MRPTDVVESLNFLFSKCSPFASHTPTEHELPVGAANVVLASSGVNSPTLLGSCSTSLARMNGFAAPPLFVQAPPCSDGFQPRLVQVARRNFVVNL